MKKKIMNSKTETINLTKDYEVVRNLSLSIISGANALTKGGDL